MPDIAVRRFLVFAGENYCPRGGWRDFQGSFATQDEAIEAAELYPGQWWEVVDLTTGTVIRTN